MLLGLLISVWCIVLSSCLWVRGLIRVLLKLVLCSWVWMLLLLLVVCVSVGVFGCEWCRVCSSLVLLLLGRLMLISYRLWLLLLVWFIVLVSELVVLILVGRVFSVVLKKLWLMVLFLMSRNWGMGFCGVICIGVVFMLVVFYIKYVWGCCKWFLSRVMFLFVIICIFFVCSLLLCGLNLFLF